MSGTPLLSIVVPSYEKHATSFSCLLKSIENYCTDLACVEIVLVIETSNLSLFEEMVGKCKAINLRVVTTEQILASFNVREAPAQFLKRIGKFTFQSTKKLGGIKASKASWVLVLDSESEFVKPFSVRKLLDDYIANKYVFYSRTESHGPCWTHSLGDVVTRNCAKALGVKSTDRWYLEYFHWFYEREKVQDLLENKVTDFFTDCFTNVNVSHRDIFENVLYYIYLSQEHKEEYTIIDVQELLSKMLPKDLLQRFNAALYGPLYKDGGLEYILKVLAVNEIHLLAPLFERYRLPFIRFEANDFSRKPLDALNALPHFCALTASHRLVWSRKKIAVCIGGDFYNPRDHVRQIKSFLEGVDCDIYLQSWVSGHEALLLDELAPKAYSFEDKKSCLALSSNVRCCEHGAQTFHDANVFPVLWAMQKSLDLIEGGDSAYDFVLWLRPDIFFEKGLYELLIELGEQGDFPNNVVYVPSVYHGQGINTHVAFGSVEAMRIYLSTFTYAVKNIAKIYLDSQHALLSNLVSHGVHILLFDLSYVLMSHSPINFQGVRLAKNEQRFCWWASSVQVPYYKDVTDFFRKRLDRMTDFVSNDCKESNFTALLCRILGVPYSPFIMSRQLFKRFAWVGMLRIYRVGLFFIRIPFLLKRGIAVYKNIRRIPSLSELRNWIAKFIR